MPVLGRKIKVFGQAWKHLSWRCMLGAVGFNNLRPGVVVLQAHSGSAQ